MKKNEFDFTPGRVTYWDMDFNDDLPLDQQLDKLKEDLAQVEYDDNLLIDVGWFPEFSREGEFVVSVIENQCWENPLVRLTASNPNSLRECIRKVIGWVKKKRVPCAS